eukprot:2171069-Prymnesium_polylepis.1
MGEPSVWFSAMMSGSSFMRVRAALSSASPAFMVATGSLFSKADAPNRPSENLWENMCVQPVRCWDECGSCLSKTNTRHPPRRTPLRERGSSMELQVK